MKLVSWNVNGIRAIISKGFGDIMSLLDADVVCLQETKVSEGILDYHIEGYYDYFCYAVKKGYSGVAVFSRIEPLSVKYGLGIEEFDIEGRTLTLEYEKFYLIVSYTPNSQEDLRRITYRTAYDEACRLYMLRLDKPCILCGDLNVAHNEIDLKNPKPNREKAGFSKAERDNFSRLLDSGYIDSYRYLYPDVIGAYSWWSYRFKARENNAGWRLDYFVVDARLKDSVIGASIHNQIFGSDHCPVELEINI